MKSAEKENMNAEIEKVLTDCIETVSKKYPGYDVELYMTKKLMEKRGKNIRQSEIEHFKKLAIGSLGKENEISFNDAEMGFLNAALAEGKKGFKEYIESIPVEVPLGGNGKKMSNRGNEKKT